MTPNTKPEGVTMIERVARALMAVTARAPGNFMPDREFPVLSMDPDYDDLPADGGEGVEEDEITQEAVLKLARAAVEAMRHAAGEMYQALFKAIEDQGFILPPDVEVHGQYIIGAVIDAALNPKDAAP